MKLERIPNAKSLLSILLLMLGGFSSAASDVRCGEDRFNGLPAGSDVLVFGETHGTNELPDFVGNVVSNFARSGKPVTLGLELPAELQGGINFYLEARSEAKGLAMLLANEFWLRESKFQDGRSSLSILRLLGTARHLRQSGSDIEVIALEGRIEEGDFERGMAAAIWHEILGNVGRKNIVLTGYLHAKPDRGAPWDPDYESVGYRLRCIARNVKLATSGGGSWHCSGGMCGASPIGASSSERKVKADDIESYLPSVGGAVVINVGRVTPSPPIWQGELKFDEKY